MHAMADGFTPRHILVGTRSHAEIIAALRAARPDLAYRGAPHTEVTADDLAWADTYVGFKRPTSVATLGSVRWVHCTGAGVDAWFASPGLPIGTLLTRTPELFGPAIAEWAVARVFAFQQQLRALDESQRAQRWAPRDMPLVAGTTAVVVGTGDVGHAIAAKLHALGVTCIGVSRTGTATPPFAAVHTTDALPALAATSDWLILALPDTPATRGLVSREVLSRCRGAVLLNCGRGAVLEETALPEALNQGWLRGAALDVFAVEPLPAASPLWHDARVMISPHSSGPTTVRGAVDGFLECLAAVERGERSRWTIDTTRGY